MTIEGPHEPGLSLVALLRAWLRDRGDVRALGHPVIREFLDGIIGDAIDEDATLPESIRQSLRNGPELRTSVEEYLGYLRAEIPGCLPGAAEGDDSLRNRMRHRVRRAARRAILGVKVRAVLESAPYDVAVLESSPYDQLLMALHGDSMLREIVKKIVGKKAGRSNRLHRADITSDVLNYFFIRAKQGKLSPRSPEKDYAVIAYLVRIARNVVGDLLKKAVGPPNTQPPDDGDFDLLPDPEPDNRAWWCVNRFAAAQAWLPPRFMGHRLDAATADQLDVKIAFFNYIELIREGEVLDEQILTEGVARGMNRTNEEVDGWLESAKHTLFQRAITRFAETGDLNVDGEQVAQMALEGLVDWEIARKLHLDREYVRRRRAEAGGLLRGPWPVP
jgi:hypothetical protein